MSNVYYDLPAGFRENLSDTFNRAVQQDASKFSALGMVRSEWIQTQQSFRIMAPLALTESTGQRFGDTQQGQQQVGYRSGFIRDFEGAIDFDRNDRDRLYTATLPQSETQMNLMSAWHRAQDQIFIQAASALTYGGLKPYNTAQTPLPAIMQIPVTWDKIANGATNTNFTIWKLEEAIKRMKEQFVDLDREMVTIAIPPSIRQAWLVYAMSAPNTVFAQAFMAWHYSPGAKPKVLGCELIESNYLETTGSVVTCLIFAKSAFIVSPPKVDLVVDIIPEKRHMIQIAIYGKWGAMRMWDEKVSLAYSDTSVAITY